jgi:hypothetical protein
LSYYSADWHTLVARTVAGDGEGIDIVPPGGTIDFTCPLLPLMPGSYGLGVEVIDADTNELITWWGGGTMLHVQPGANAEGQMLIPHEWQIRHSASREAALGPFVELKVG